MAQSLEETRSRTPRSSRFPWLALIVLVASIYLFWILPRQFPTKRVEVEFDAPSKTGGARAEGRIE